MFVPIVHHWKGGWCENNCHPTFQELVDMSERVDEQAISTSLSSAFFEVSEDDLLNNWLAMNTQGQRTCGCEDHCHCKEEYDDLWSRMQRMCGETIRK